MHDDVLKPLSLVFSPIKTKLVVTNIETTNPNQQDTLIVV